MSATTTTAAATATTATMTTISASATISQPFFLPASPPAELSPATSLCGNINSSSNSSSSNSSSSSIKTDNAVIEKPIVLNLDELYVCEIVRAVRIDGASFFYYHCPSCIEALTPLIGDRHLNVIFRHEIKMLGLDVLQTIVCERCQRSVIQRFYVTTCQDCSEFCRSLYTTLIEQNQITFITKPSSSLGDYNDYLDENNTYERRLTIRNLIDNPMLMYSDEYSDDVKWLGELAVRQYDCYFPVDKLEQLKQNVHNYLALDRIDAKLVMSDGGAMMRRDDQANKQFDDYHHHHDDDDDDDDEKNRCRKVDNSEPPKKRLKA
nr:hypothetical protein Caab_031 [Calliteara abietis nucleopolyhedrovirus]